LFLSILLALKKNITEEHMIGDAFKFVNLSLKQEGFVTYRDNNKGRVLGRGDVGKNSSIIIKKCDVCRRLET